MWWRCKAQGSFEGRIAARDVFDDAGNMLVGAGKEIDDAVIERERLPVRCPRLSLPPPPLELRT